MQSLGGVQFALDDRTSSMGLYGAGYASAILLNNPGTIVALSPVLSFGSWGDPAGILYEFKSLDCFVENTNLINIRLTDYDNIVIKPYYNNSTVIVNSFTSTDRQAGGEAQYARKITDEIGAGATVRYTYLREETNPVKITSGRLEWLVDAYYKSPDGLTAAISCGFMGALFENRAKTDNYYTYVGDYNYFDYTLEGFSGKLLNSIMDIEVKNSWINLGAGFEYDRPGEVRAYLSGGAMINAAMESTFTAHFSDTVTTSTDKGSGYYADMGIRAYLPASFVLSASAKGRRMDFTGTDKSVTPEGTQYSKYNGAMTLGAAYDTAVIKVPVEYYVNVNDKDENSVYKRFGGIRGGVEYIFSEMFALRLGADWPGLHEPAPGRLSVTEYAITGGAGFNYGGLKLNAGCRYFSQKEKRSTGFISHNYELNLTHVMADITYGF